MPKMCPILDFPNTLEITDFSHITKENVVMNIENYAETIEGADTDAAIFEAEAEYALNEQLHDARSAFSSLRKKHFG